MRGDVRGGGRWQHLLRFDWLPAGRIDVMAGDRAQVQWLRGSFSA